MLSPSNIYSLSFFLDPFLRWRKVLFIMVSPSFNSGFWWWELEDTRLIRCFLHVLVGWVGYWVCSTVQAGQSVINIAPIRWEHLFNVELTVAGFRHYLLWFTNHVSIVLHTFFGSFLYRQVSRDLCLIGQALIRRKWHFWVGILGLWAGSNPLLLQYLVGPPR